MANTSTLRIIIQALDEFSGELNKLRVSINRIGTDFSKVAASAKAAAVPISNISKTSPQYEKLSKSFEGLRNSIGQIVSPLGKVAASSAQATSALSALAALGPSFTQLNASISQLNSNLASVTTKTAAAGNAAKVTSRSFRDFAQQATAFQQIGTRLGMMAAIMVTTVAVPIKAAADFERALARVIAVTEGGKAAFKSMERTASELGRTTRYTATEVAQGMQYLGMAGFDAAQTMSAIGPALTLAAAGSMSLAQAADISTNIMTAMRVPVEELSHVIDVLARTSTSSNTSVIQMSEALKYTAPLAKSAGVSLEEVSAAIGVLGNNGIQASLAGTSLRGMFLSLAAPTKRARDTLAEMGVTIARNEDGTINFVETLKRFRDAQIDLADANNLFLRRSAAGAVALSQQVAEVEKLTKANINAVRAGTEMYNLMEDNLIGALIRLSSAFDGFLRSIGEPALKPLKLIVLWLAELLDKTAELLTTFPNLARAFSLLVGTVGVTFGVIAALSISVAGLIQIWRGLVYIKAVGWFTAITGAVFGTIAAIVKLAATGGLISALMIKMDLLSKAAMALYATLTTAFVLTPWTAAIAAAIALLGSLVVRSVLFTQTSASLIDSEKKKVAAIDATLKSYNELRKAMKATEKDSETNAEINLKMRKFLLETAKAHKNLSIEARDAADSIDIMSGALNNGLTALEAFKASAEKQRLQSLTSQLVLYQGELRKARGEDKNPFVRIWEWIDLTIKQAQDASEELDHMGEANYRFYSRVADVKNREAQNLREVTEKVRDEAQTLFAAMEEMGAISFNWGDDVLEAVLSSEGIIDPQTIEIYKEEFNKIKEARKKLDADMLESAIYKDDRTIESLRISVNKQIELLQDLGKAAQEAVKAGDFGLASRIAADTAKAREEQKRLSDKYYDAIMERKKEDLSLQDDIIAQRQKEEKIAHETLAIKSASNELTIRDRGIEGKRIAAAEAETKKLAQENNELRAQIYQSEEQAIQDMKEIRETEISRKRLVGDISSDEEKSQRLQLDIDVTEASKKLMDDRVAYATSKYETETDLVRTSFNNQKAAAKAYTDASLALVDDETRLRNESADKITRKTHQMTMARLKAEPESLDRLRREEAEEIQFLKDTNSEKFQLTEEFELMILEKEQEYFFKRAELMKKASAKDRRFLEEESRAIRDLKIKKLDEELNLSDFRYRQGEISLEEHYNNRRRITEAKLNAEIEQLEEKLILAQSIAEQNAVKAKIEIIIEEKRIRTSELDRSEFEDRERAERAIQHHIIDAKRKSLDEWHVEERQAIEKQAFDLAQVEARKGFIREHVETIRPGTSDETEFVKKLEEYDALEKRAQEKFIADQNRELELRNLKEQESLIDSRVDALPEGDLINRAQLEFDSFKNLQDQKRIEIENFVRDADMKAEMLSNLNIERDKKEAAMHRNIMQAKLGYTSQIFGNMSDMFGGLYEASGKKLTVFARLQKATAVAQTVIETFKAAQGAAAAVAQIPYYGPALAVSAAAAQIAMGMARVYAIQAQPLAEGGKVRDSSEFSKKVKLGKKEVPIRVTAKEWKFPKERVNQYGADFFEALRSKKASKSITSLLTVKGNAHAKIQKLKTLYGEIPGFSPDAKADNIPTVALPGDYILPVGTARKYGRSFMRALDTGVLPVELIRFFMASGKSKYADGGEIKGVSPHSKADNIPIMATADEWVMPVRAVKKYGKKVMAAIQEGLIPAELFSSLRMPTINIPTPSVRYAYAAGGPVTAPAPISTQPTKSDPIPRAMREDMKKANAATPDTREEIAIYNIIDPRDMDRWASSPPGQRAILNVISSRSTTVRRILR